MVDIAWLIPVLPLFGFLIIGLGHSILNKTIIGILGCSTILASFIIVLTFLLPAIDQPFTPVTISYFTWMKAGSLIVPFSFLIDPLTILMMSIITGVGFLIHLYSAGYMSHDEGFARYFAFLNLFVFSMLLLVMGSNYVVLFAGWEGVGFCSYMLIGFWYKNQNYNNAAKKAFIMNRIGDLGFLLGMLLIFTTFGSLEYSEVFGKAATSGVDGQIFTWITLLLFVGAMGKSAQIPLYTWLPDAMAGPTPVSALIHAATMVTAGIYMIVRSNILYSLAPFTLEFIGIVGLATAIFAATIGLVQNDIKKVLAYSTVSQLGYMFFALGLGAYSTAVFHLATHAFFKALLFLGAGSVIHAMSGEQDIRNMGGLSKKLPITFITFLIATLAISGIPPFAGFFSKDEILAHAFEHNPILWVAALIGALMTTFYMFRLVALTFWGSFRGNDHQRSHLHESPAIMTIPLIVLAILSTVSGFIGFPEVFGGSNFLKNYLSPIIYPTSHEQAAHLSHSTEILLMCISTGAVILVIIMTLFYYLSKKALPAAEGDDTSGAHKLLYNKYYVDEIYRASITKPLYALSEGFYNFIELKVIDPMVNFWGKVSTQGSSALRYIQSGSISLYLFTMVIGIIIIIFFNTFIKF